MIPPLRLHGVGGLRRRLITSWRHPWKFIPDLGTVDNFVQAWTQDFSRYALNSAFVSVTSTVLVVWLSSMMAYARASTSLA